jgi:hypothetical protein
MISFLLPQTHGNRVHLSRATRAPQKSCSLIYSLGALRNPSRIIPHNLLIRQTGDISEVRTERTYDLQVTIQHRFLLASGLTGFRILSIVLYRKEYNVSETESICILRWAVQGTLLGPLERANLNHRTTYVESSRVESSLMLRPTVSRSVCLGIKHPSGAYDHIFITVRQLRVCPCGALSLTRGRVCGLQLLLALANAVILGSESRGTRDHILLSQIRDFPFCRLLRLASVRCLRLHMGYNVCQYNHNYINTEIRLSVGDNGKM